jgi:hypothetical protein
MASEARFLFFCRRMKIMADVIESAETRQRLSDLMGKMLMLKEHL